MGGMTRIRRNISPLRYPGGKAKLAPLVSGLVERNWGAPPVMVELFAGGAGLGLSLLDAGIIGGLHLNDLDYGVYAFWCSILWETEDFCDMVMGTPVTVEEWHLQQEKYLNPKQTTLLEAGYATFFMNRTNHSGVLTGRPIGGLRQDGKYGIGCRYNAPKLVERIKHVAGMRDLIKVTNQDATAVIAEHNHDSNTLLFVDPPYVVQGNSLYRQTPFCEEQHARLADQLHQTTTPWILTYDNHPLITDTLYGQQTQKDTVLRYSLNSRKRETEKMILSPNLKH